MPLRRLQSLVLCALTCLIASTAPAQPPAFPSAEGFGANATGGRGGHVYHVTSLADTNTQGTLRHALSSNSPSGPRTIVFDVGGYIDISSKLGAVRPDVTVAGQTAPGGGIGIRGHQTSLGADNLIVRHIRFRPGKSAGRVDALSVNDKADNTIIDHCSIQFSYDENGSMTSPENVTEQWSINAWGLEDHSAGALLTANDTTIHHMLWAHNHTRNPKARGGLLDWVNNVVFDWDIPYILADTTGGYHYANVVNTYFVSATPQNRAFTSGRTDADGNPTYHLYLQNVWLDGNDNDVLDVSGTDFGLVSGSVEQINSPFPVPAANAVAAHDTLLAYKLVLSKTGAFPRDQVDALLIDDVKTFRRRIITRESDLGLPDGGFGILDPGNVPIDSDLDGMRDIWEEAFDQLDPAVADNNGDFNANGYTNLEDYLNFLGAPHAIATVNKAIDINLRTWTSGFASNATYTLSNVQNGAAQLKPDGFTVTFTPATDFKGLAGFTYTVDDGSVYSEPIAVLVSSFSGVNELTWSGEGSTTWQALGAENFTDEEAAPSPFRNGDTVTFNDAGSPAVSLSGALQPAAVTVDSTQDYSFGGTGSLNGSMTLTKLGAGDLTLDTDNSYSGGTVIYDGTVFMNQPSSLGSGPLTLAGGSLFIGGEHDIPMPIKITSSGFIGGGGNNTIQSSFSGSGDLVLDIGNIFTFETPITDFSGSFDLADNGGMIRFNQGSGVWGAPNAHVDAGTQGTITSRLNNPGELFFGAISGGANSTLWPTQQAGSPGALDTFTIGALNIDTTFAGTIEDRNHILRIVKTGSGVWTLAGNNNFTGGLVVNNGGLVVDGTTSAGPVSFTNGMLGGNGTLAGPVTLQADPIPGSALAAAWPLDSEAGVSAVDIGPNSINASLVNTADETWNEARWGNGLFLDGVDDYLTAPHNPAIDFGAGSFTVSLWILHAPTDASSGEEGILTKGSIGGNGGTGKRYGLYSKAGDFRFAIDDNVTKTEIGVSSAAFHTGDWVHVAAVRDAAADQIRLHANGVLVSAIADNTGNISQTEPLIVGRYPLVDANALHYAGGVDEVRIYHQALSQTQIDALAAAGPDAHSVVTRIEPGNSAGTLTIDGNLTVENDVHLNFELGSASDRLDVLGDLTLGGVVNIAQGPGTIQPGAHTLITYTGALNLGSLVLGAMPSGAEGTLDTSTPGEIQLLVDINNTVGAWQLYGQ